MPYLHALGRRLEAERDLADFRSGFIRSRAQLARLASTDDPLVVGPFVSEVGFECLYWVPMLNWFTERYGIAPDRVTAFSRGGPVSWYHGLANRYIDVFDYLTPHELKRQQAARVARTRNEKQLRRGEFEKLLLRAAALGEDVRILDPSLMYRLFWAVWSSRRPARRVLDHVRFREFEAPVVEGVLDGLPEKYVAVKPYFSGCFPETAGNRRFLADLLASLTRKTEVVLLATGIDLDEHEDYAASADRVTGISSLVEPRTNLEVQSAVVRGAEALYTTYGGFAHLGPFLGAPTFAFYSEDTFNHVHLDVMRRAVTELRDHSRAGFVLLHTRDVPLVEPLGLTQ